jgi:hypothetical protein
MVPAVTRRCKGVICCAGFAAGSLDLRLYFLKRIPSAFRVVIVERHDGSVERFLGLIQPARDIFNRTTNVSILSIRDSHEQHPYEVTAAAPLAVYVHPSSFRWAAKTRLPFHGRVLLS